MSLLRQCTMPQGQLQTCSEKQRLRSKACSQINLFPLGHHFFTSSSCSKNSKQCELGRKNSFSCIAQNKILTKIEMDKIVSKNSLTVNFSNRNEVNALPSITTFDKIKGILIKKSIFQRFKECNKENGRYHQELQELSRQDELSKPKINIKTNFKLPTSSQLLKNQRKSLSLISEASSSLHLCNRQQRISGNYPNQILRLNNVSLTKYSPKECVIQVLDESRQTPVNSRLKVVQKLQSITQACSQTVEDSKIQKQISLFAKYSQKMDEGLLRKKKKLDKVFHFRL